MKEYKVTFTYAVKVQAENEGEANDMAWKLFAYADPANADTFMCFVEAVDVWDTNEDGNHTCVDCESEVDPDETFGNREFSDPRCEDCYDTHRYKS